MTQYNVKTQRYTEALKGKDGLKGMKIAVVKEGYLQEGDLRASDWGHLRRNLNAEKEILDFLKERMRNILKENKVKNDIIEASISSHIGDNYLDLFKKSKDV